ncbi:unnamed protein product [Pleuronectes platessa]|uniref:Uncharacterized protein n=1 Tax=Pleuronectes platessa TaxID=8262 RepID=A0A9N7TYM8_PLEPL|nr:unnamed protein product [Pleuronectes platessa]
MAKCNIKFSTAAAAMVEAAAIQPNPNESGSPRFVHPGWRVMTALLCWGAYLLSVVGGLPWGSALAVQVRKGRAEGHGIQGHMGTDVHFSLALPNLLPPPPPRGLQATSMLSL